MFTNFIHNAYPIFIEEGFELISNESEVDIFSKEKDVIRLIKRQNTMLYIVNVWNMQNTDLETLKFRNDSYEQRLKGVFKELNCSYLLVLNLLITEEEITLNNPVEFQPNNEIYMISWIVDLYSKKIIVPKKEIDEVLNIRELIQKVFNIIYPEFDLKDSDLSKYGHRMKKKIILKQKSKNTSLTYGLIMLNIILWLLMELNGGSTNINTLLLFGANDRFLILERNQYWRLISSTLLHIGISHLLYNNLALYLFGTRVERYFGKIKFLAIYFITGIIGSIASIFFSDVISAGASGAIYGILGALLVLAYMTNKEIDGLNSYIILIMIMSGIGMGWVMPSIDNAAHLAGLFTGILTGIIMLNQGKKT